jgi:hypothetical protein
MANDKIRLNAPSVAGGKDVSTHTLASGEDIGRSTLAIYTPGAGSTPGTAADIDDANPLPTKLVDIGTAATDAHILDAVAALGDILAALGATLDVSGSVSVSSAVDVASLPPLPAGSSVIGHVIVDSAGSVSVTSLPSLPAGTNTIGKIDQGAAGVSAWPVSLASLPAFAATPTVNLGTIGGAATEAKQDTGNTSLATLAGIVSAGAALANISDRVGRLLGLITGKDGATAASASNGVPVAPETSSLWDVSSRAARLIGALTGINGSGVATGANPVPVQMSDGSAVYTAAKSSQLPTSIGPAAGSASLSTVPPTSTTYFTGTITSATVIQVVNGPCTVYHVEATNGSGGNLFVGLYDTSTTPSNGTDFPKIEVAAPNGSPATRDLATRGVKFSNKLYVVVASTSRSATPAAQTAVGITIVYDT